MERHSVSSMAAVRGGKNSNDTSMSPWPRKRLLRSGAVNITRRTPPRRVSSCRETTAGFKPSQSETVSFSVLHARSRSEVALPLDRETGVLQPALDLIGSKAEAAMGGLLAQEFKLVRREVDHEQSCRLA